MNSTTASNSGTGDARLAIRLERGLLAQVDNYAALVSAQFPGLTVSRSDAIRALLIQGLKTTAFGKSAGEVQP